MQDIASSRTGTIMRGDTPSAVEKEIEYRVKLSKNEGQI